MIIDSMRNYLVQSASGTQEALRAATLRRTEDAGRKSDYYEHLTTRVGEVEQGYSGRNLDLMA